MKRFLLLTLAVIGLTTLVGCTAEQLAQWTATKQKLEDAKAPTTQAVSDLQKQLNSLRAEIATLSPDDPVRKATEAKLVKVNESLAAAQVKLGQLDGALAAADSAIRSLSTGEPFDPKVTAAVKDIPYGNLALSVIGLVGWGIREIKNAGKAKQAEAAIIEIAGDTAASASDAPFSTPTAAIMSKLGVDTPGTADAQVKAIPRSMTQL